MHLRFCKYCNLTFKTWIIHAKVCDECKTKQYQIRDKRKKENAPDKKKERELRDQKVKELEVLVKENPFAMIRM